MISIHKESYQESKVIEVYNHDENKWVRLEEKLKDVGFNEEQVNLLNEIFDKFANLKIETS